MNIEKLESILGTFAKAAVFSNEDRAALRIACDLVNALRTEGELPRNFNAEDLVAEVVNTRARPAGAHARAYMTSQDGKPVHYVRLGPLETKQFPHGLALATTTETREEADSFAKLVDAYINEAYCAPAHGARK